MLEGYILSENKQSRKNSIREGGKHCGQFKAPNP
jgi:hypothetical protein